MTDRRPDMRRDALLYRALVPKGYRPANDSDIEKLLDTVEEKPIDSEKLQRVLRKIDGEQFTFARELVVDDYMIADLSEQDRELVVLHRSRNEPLPPDLEEKIREIEERASEGEENECDSDG